MLNHDTRIFPDHTDPQRRYDFSAPVAEVTRHPVDPDRWGLKNLSNERCVITTAEGAIRDVEPGRSLSLAVGTRVNFGYAEAEILG